MRIIRLSLHHADAIAIERVSLSIQAAVVSFHHNRKTGCGARRADLHRIVPHNIALYVGCLIAMMLETPNENAEAVELIRLETFYDRGPEPVILYGVAIFNLAQRKIGRDPMAFGILGDFIRNGHVEHARQNPPYLAVLGPDQTPVVGWHWPGRLGFGLGR